MISDHSTEIQRLTLWQQHFPQLTHTQDAELRYMMNSASYAVIPAHELVFYPGKTCDKYLLLLSGLIKVRVISDEGNELLLYYVSGGDSCVLTTSCLMGGEYYPAEGITETDIEAFIISRSAFHRCLATSFQFQEFVFKNFSSRLTDIIKRISTISFGSIDRRLAHRLLISEDKFVKKTHHDLALELATAREVVSRHLKKFEQNGWVKLHRGSIEILNAAALHKTL